MSASLDIHLIDDTPNAPPEPLPPPTRNGLPPGWDRPPTLFEPPKPTQLPTLPPPTATPTGLPPGTIPPLNYVPPPGDPNFMGPMPPGWLPFAEPANLPPFHGQELPWAVPEEIANADPAELAEAKARIDRRKRAERIKDLEHEIDPPTLKEHVPTLKKVPESKGMTGMLDGIFGTGAGAGIASLAPPFAAAKAIEAYVKQRIARPAEIAEMGADSAKRLARNDITGLTRPLEEVPGAFGDLVKSANRVGAAFHEASAAFIERGKQIKGFSAPLTGANVENDIRRLYTDIKDAQELGPELARLTTAQGELDQTMADVLRPIKEQIVGGMADAAEMLKSWLEFSRPFIQANADIMKWLRETIATMATGLAQVVKTLPMTGPLVQALQDIANNTRPAPPKKDPLIAEQMAKLDEKIQWAHGMPKMPPGPGTGSQLNVPIFQNQRR